MQLRDLLSKGGFRLTKWLRNNSKVLNFILHEERAPSLLDLDLDKDKPPIQRALGLHWNMETDMFTFKVNLKEKPNTHKGILSLTSSLYNPLGLIAPIKEELDIPVTNSTFWSDSTCLLQHIKNKSRRLHTFVANRLSIIHELSTPYQWRHVPSELNPADEVNRGLTVKDMINNSKWFNGPMLLRKKEESWPSNLTNVQNELSLNDPELKLDVQSHSQMTIFFQV